MGSKSVFPEIGGSRDGEEICAVMEKFTTLIGMMSLRVWVHGKIAETINFKYV